MPCRFEHVGAGVGLVLLGVDAVVHHMHPAGVDARVAAQHVVAHPAPTPRSPRRPPRSPSARPRTTARSRRRAARPSTAAAAPGCARVITCGTPCSSLATWPAMFAYQVCECTTSAPSHPAAIARSVPSVRSAGLAPTSAGRHAVRRDARLVPRCPHALDPDVDQPAQLAGEVLDVHARTAVDLGRVLPGEQVDAHATDPGLVRRAYGIAPGMADRRFCRSSSPAARASD